MQRNGYTLDRARVVPAVVLVVLLLVGALLPYVTLAYDNYASEPIRPTHPLWPGTNMMRLMNLTYLTAGPDASADGLQRGVDVFILGASAHQVGIVVAIVTIGGLFKDEVNKFFWWPLHLSGWLLVLGTAALFAGWGLLSNQGVDVDLGPGWVPLALAGILTLVLTFRSRSRLDTYRGL